MHVCYVFSKNKTCTYSLIKYAQKIVLARCQCFQSICTYSLIKCARTCAFAYVFTFFRKICITVANYVFVNNDACTILLRNQLESYLYYVINPKLPYHHTIFEHCVLKKFGFSVQYSTPPSQCDECLTFWFSVYCVCVCTCVCVLPVFPINLLSYGQSVPWIVCPFKVISCHTVGSKNRCQK